MNKDRQTDRQIDRELSRDATGKGKKGENTARIRGMLTEKKYTNFF